MGLTGQILTVPAAFLYANAFEWAFHKYVLHGLGKRPKSFWSFHWHEHHREVRRNDFYDRAYTGPFFRWNAQTKEIVALLLGALIHLPVLLISPLAYITLIYCGLRYYFVHRKAHTNPQWAKTHLPWHYDHHFGTNQHANWCVTRPIFDMLLGTRIRYFPKE